MAADKNFKLTHTSPIAVRKKIFRSILLNLKAQMQGGKASVMLTGDPGVGKTVGVKQFATLCGLELIVIEAPHIVEEHLIQIPFVEFNPVSEHTKKGTAQVDGKTFEIVLGRSNLLTIIEQKKKISDSVLLKMIYDGKHRDSETLRALWEAFGGSEKLIPDMIHDIRQRFTTLLFVDEFFRAGGAGIGVKNALRGFLNKKVGSEDLPHHLALVYASNVNDAGVETEMNRNAEFRYVDVNAPGKEEWFAWFTRKFKGDKAIKLKKEVVDGFFSALEEEHMSYNDIESEVRTSPRRWEQVMLYVNEALPCKSDADAKSLMTNIHHAFQHFKSKDKSSLLKTVAKAVADMIKDTSNITIAWNEINPETDWRDTLRHQIAMKKKMGEHRSYIPIIAGAPGTSKTTFAYKVAQESNLALIHYDCSVLRAEDLIGIPLPTKEGGERGVKFSEPSFYKEIMQLSEKAYKDRIAEIQTNIKQKKISKELGDAQIKEFKDGKYQFLLFLDEVNRVHSVKVFNALRKVLLEKEVADMKLPDSFIIIAAMNPDDVGTMDLSGHMADVTDVIHVAPSWSGVKDYLASRKLDVRHEDAPKIALDLVTKFMDRWATKDRKNENHEFKLEITQGEPTYISPREIDDLFTNTAILVDSVWDEHFAMVDMNEPETVRDFREAMAHDIADSFEETLKSIMHKHDADNPDFLGDVRRWLIGAEETDIGRALTTITKKADTTFEEVLEPYWEGTMKKHLSADPEFINYIEGMDISDVTDQVIAFITPRIKNAKDVVDHVMTKAHAKKELDGKEIKVAEEKVSRVDHFVREFIHAIKIRKLSYEMIDAVATTLRKYLDDLATNDDITSFGDEGEGVDFMELLEELNSLTAFINKEVQS